METLEVAFNSFISTISERRTILFLMVAVLFWFFTRKPKGLLVEQEKSINALIEQTASKTFDSREDRQDYYDFCLKFRDQQASETYIEKIVGTIEWDISGLIGTVITGVIAFLVLLGFTENIPDQVYAAWTMVLGFYFGKSSRTK